MKANLYISDETFLYNGKDSDEDVIRKLNDFAVLFNHIILKNKGDVVLLRNNEFYSVPVFFDKRTMSDVLFSGADEFRDLSNLMLQYLTYFKNENLTQVELLERLKNKNELNAIIVLNLPEVIDEQHNDYVIFNITDWFSFHRKQLYVRPHKEIQFFMDDVLLYFEKIIVHNDNVRLMKSVYKTHLKQIVTYLGYLNDYLFQDYKEYMESKQGDFVSFLNFFATKHSIDGASLEGNKKNEFYKEFMFQGRKENRYCEPHLKIYKNDKQEKNNHCRIYFSKIKDSDEYVFVGIIKEHV